MDLWTDQEEGGLEVSKFRIGFCWDGWGEGGDGWGEGLVDYGSRKKNISN